MTPPDRILEQVARDRVHAVARQRPSARPDGGVAADAAPSDPPIGRRARRRAEMSSAEPASPVERGTPAGRAPVGGARWTPVRPVDRRPDGDPAPGDLGPGDDRDPVGEPVADATDVADVVVRGRAEALAAASAGYTAAYGHPLDHPGEPAPADGRRWWLSTRHAVVAGIAVAVLAGGVVVRATTQIPDPPVALAALAAAQAAPVREDTAGGSAVGGAQPGEDPVAPGSGTGAATGPGAGAQADPAGPAGSAAAAGPATASGVPPAAAPGVVVHVVGQVPTPGVLTLPSGSRVSDAVAAAGGPGPEADLSLVNLARVVVDGEQIRIPARGEAVRPPTGVGSAGPPAAGAAPAPVPLNTADLAALDSLPGIGPVLAQRIVDWRTDNGPFRSVEELGEVSGIGEALLTRLRPLVRV